MYPSNQVFSAFSFITVVLALVPLPWHLEAWNTGTCLFMTWTALASLNFFINSIIWNGNVVNWAPVWCDISAKIIVGISVAFPAASLCINRRLYHIACVNRCVIPTRGEKLRAVCVDLAIGVGIPIIVMVLQYVVQGHRFNIFEDIGCYPFSYNTPLTFVLLDGPPTVISIVSGIYSVMTILLFQKRRTEFKEILSSNANLNSRQYFRLMALAGVLVVGSFPLTLALLCINATSSQIRPWISWEDTHFGFSRVDQFPSVVWRSNQATGAILELTRWLVVACGFIFFAFFGFADEALKHYKIAFGSIARFLPSRLSVKLGTSNSSTSGLGKFENNSTDQVLPICVQRHVGKCDSNDSLSVFSAKKQNYFSDDSALNPTSPYAPNQSDITLVVPSEQHIFFPTASTSFLDLSCANDQV